MIDPQFILSLIADVQNIKGSLSAEEKKEIFKRFVCTVKTYTSGMAQSSGVPTESREDNMRHIAEVLHYSTSCVRYSFPLSFCGVFENDETCINCISGALKNHFSSWEK